MAMEGFKELQETVNGDDFAVNKILESAKSTSEEPFEHGESYASDAV